MRSRASGVPPVAGRRRWAAPAVAVALAVSSCAPEEDRHIVRLVDELPRAAIRSPLEDLPPWESVLAGLDETPVSPRDLGLGEAAAAAGCRPGAAEILCGGGGEPFHLRLRFAIEPHGHYRIGLRERAERPSCASLHLRDEERSERIPLGTGGAEWHRISRVWSAGPAARELRLAVRGSCSVSLAGLRVVRLALGVAEETARLAALGATGQGPRMVQFGSLLPRGDAESVRPPADESFGFREAIYAPVPTDLTFELRPPPEARLRFSYGLHAASRIGDRVRFEVLLGDGAGATPRPIWSRELHLDEASWHWHEAVVDLAAWSGRRIALTLRTRATGERGHALWGTPTVDTPRRDGDPPNVILIAVDTLRADRLSAYGYGKPTSPHLDALARDGALFEQAVSQSNYTRPAFASLFTGHLVVRHRLVGLDRPALGEVPTLAEIFRRRGWTTHAIAYKPALYEPGVLTRGFERFFNVPRRLHRAEENLEQALAWLEANGDRRFFLFLHFNDPHQPFSQPPEFVGRETARGLQAFGAELPFHLRGTIGVCPPCREHPRFADDFRRLARELYDEEVAYVDDRIGAFLRALDERGLYDDTAIAFVSDHGETLWDHLDFYDHGGISQYDELIRVPLIVKPPTGRGFARGARVAAQVRLFDSMPTLLELAGIEPAVEGLDARSLTPLLRRPASAERQESWALSSNELSGALRGGGWKYVFPVWMAEARQPGPRLERERLYDLTDDPGETADLSAERPEVLGSMRARTAELLAGAVGGRFVLVVDDGPPGEYRIAIDAGSGARRDPMVHLGIPPAGGSSSRGLEFAGPRPAGRLLLFVRLEGAGAGPPRVALSPPEAPGGAPSGVRTATVVAWEPGGLERLLAAPEPGVYLIEAPPRLPAGTATETSSLDAQREEALRALGYIQ